MWSIFFGQNRGPVNRAALYEASSLCHLAPARRTHSACALRMRNAVSSLPPFNPIYRSSQDALTKAGDWERSSKSSTHMVQHTEVKWVFITAWTTHWVVYAVTTSFCVINRPVRRYLGYVNLGKLACLEFEWLMENESWRRRAIGCM